MSIWSQKKSISALEKYGLPKDKLTQWQQWIRCAQDHELYRVNPRYLAHALNWSEALTLDVLTASVAENFWQIEWDVHCSSCDNLLQRADNLSKLQSHQHCEMCHGEVEIHLDEEVTPRVSVLADLRRLRATRRDDPAFHEQVDQEQGRLPALNLINRNLFRELLSAQTLPCDSSLGVQHMAVFFSDLKASTTLYQTLGDAQAYQLVRQHFDIIFAAVEKHGGSAIKTIGDGVMGTFSSNAAALRSAIESVQGIKALNNETGLSDENRLALKIGLHAGQCIVVTLNGRLDYFGSTVNIAARLGDLARGNDILLSKSFLNDEEGPAIASNLQYESEETITLRGIANEIEVCRLQID